MYPGIIGAAALMFGNAVAAYTLDPFQTYATSKPADAVAVGDVTGDGRDDVVLTTIAYGSAQESKVLVFVQQLDGTLAAPFSHSYLSPMTSGTTGLALGDFDRDGILDIVVGHESGITILASNPAQPDQPRIRVVEGLMNSEDVAIKDVNRDGFPDIVVQSATRGAQMFFGDGAGGIQATAVIPTKTDGFNSFAVEDMNGDRSPDLVVASGQGFTYLSVHTNNRRGRFGEASFRHLLGYWPKGLAVGDFNGDGRKDLATSKHGSFQRIDVFLQREGGQFDLVPTGSYEGPSAMISTDLDGDRRDDLIVTHSSIAAIGVFFQSATGLQPETLYFGPPVSAFGVHYNSQGLAVGDINHDGCKDIVGANSDVGLFWLHGKDCQDPLFEPADLSVALAGSATAVSVGLANGPGTESIESPLVRLDLAVRLGTLQTGALPAGCVIQSQTARSQRIECLVETMAPEATASLTIPVGFTGTGKPGALVATVQAQTNTREKSTSNNRAWRQFTQQAVIPSLAPGQAGSVGARSRPAALRTAPRSHSVHGNTKKRNAPSSGVIVERKTGKANLIQENGTGTWRGP